MSVRDRLWQLPLRLSTGAYILDAGLSKWGADEETAKQLHGLAAGAYPFLSEMDPRQFTMAESAGEVAIGGLLLAPFVSGRAAGAALTAFAGGVLGIYARTPSMRRPGTPFPSHDGIPLAKDSWLAGIGLALLIGCSSRRRSGAARRPAVAST